MSELPKTRKIMRRGNENPREITSPDLYMEETMKDVQHEHKSEMLQHIKQLILDDVRELSETKQKEISTALDRAIEETIDQFPHDFMQRKNTEQIKYIILSRIDEKTLQDLPIETQTAQKQGILEDLKVDRMARKEAHAREKIEKNEHLNTSQEYIQESISISEEIDALQERTKPEIGHLLQRGADAGISIIALTHEIVDQMTSDYYSAKIKTENGINSAMDNGTSEYQLVYDHALNKILLEYEPFIEPPHTTELRAIKKKIKSIQNPDIRHTLNEQLDSYYEQYIEEALQVLKTSIGPMIEKRIHSNKEDKKPGLLRIPQTQKKEEYSVRIEGATPKTEQEKQKIGKIVSGFFKKIFQ